MAKKSKKARVRRQKIKRREMKVYRQMRIDVMRYRRRFLSSDGTIDKRTMYLNACNMNEAVDLHQDLCKYAIVAEYFALYGGNRKPKIGDCTCLGTRRSS